MRIRTIKPEFWAHPVMVRQHDATKLLAIGLLNYADDEGFFYAEPKLVRAALRPLDEDSTIVRGCLDALSKIGYIAVREHPTHGLIGVVLSFKTHQRVDRPQRSKIRPFYDESTAQEQEFEQPGLFDDRSTNNRRTLATNAPREQGTGNEGTGNGIPPSREGGAEELALEHPAAESATTPVSAETIYDAYPRKVGKQDALKAITKAAKRVKANTPLDALVFLLERTKSYAAAVAEWPEADRQYVPHPATWFNGGRYDDEQWTWRRNAPPAGTPVDTLRGPEGPNGHLYRAW